MENFKYQTEQFADIRILRYKAVGFENLDERQKKLVYYLSQAALWGRDIFWDQNFKYNLFLRKNLENIYKTYSGNRESDDFKNFVVYLKRVWFSNGIHHHNSQIKLSPGFSESFLSTLVENSSKPDFVENQDFNNVLEGLTKIIFDVDFAPKKVNQEAGQDLVLTSAVNFYDGVNQEEVEDFYAKMKNPTDDQPISYGLNSKLVKRDGQIFEDVWKIGGLYGAAISKIVENLRMAIKYAENQAQANYFEHLIEYYSTGDLKKFDDYSIAWVKETESVVDTINGFIEVYEDPLGRKATFESTVSITDFEATKRARAISDNASWFEQNSPTNSRFKKDEIKGVSARAINVMMESGDCSPSTPIGINLPNADWIREEFGSKSVTISNIIDAYEEVSKTSGALDEFAFSQEEKDLSREFGGVGSKLHVDLHEIAGHGSGKLLPGVGDPAETLKSYATTIEEARADLVALYYAIDPKLVELGLMDDLRPGFAEYNSYIRGGLLVQLVRVPLGQNVEEAHMRNRQLIAKWAYERGKPQNIIEKISMDSKTYFVVNDHAGLREIFGELLAEIQRIKSEGDYEAAKNLVENYAVKVDRELHEEVLERWSKLNIAPYSGFINPIFEGIFENNELSAVNLSYCEDFTEQMLYYSANYGVL